MSVLSWMHPRISTERVTFLSSLPSYTYYQVRNTMAGGSFFGVNFPSHAQRGSCSSPLAASQAVESCSRGDDLPALFSESCGLTGSKRFRSSSDVSPPPLVLIPLLDCLCGGLYSKLSIFFLRLAPTFRPPFLVLVESVRAF